MVRIPAVLRCRLLRPVLHAGLLDGRGLKGARLVQVDLPGPADLGLEVGLGDDQACEKGDAARFGELRVCIIECSHSREVVHAPKGKTMPPSINR